MIIWVIFIHLGAYGILKLIIEKEKDC